MNKRNRLLEKYYPACTTVTMALNNGREDIDKRQEAVLGMVEGVDYVLENEIEGPLQEAIIINKIKQAILKTYRKNQYPAVSPDDIPDQPEKDYQFIIEDVKMSLEGRDLKILEDMLNGLDKNQIMKRHDIGKQTFYNTKNKIKKLIEEMKN